VTKTRLHNLVRAKAKQLGKIQEALGYRFNDRTLLLQAFVHRSYVFENPEPGLTSNERMEFLGDAIINFLVAEYLYFRFPDSPEGELTLLRAALVRLETLADWARRLGLGQALLLGRGEESAGGRDRTANLGRCFEAVIASLYLDGGLEPVRSVVQPLVDAVLQGERRLPVEIKDAKSRLQELIQKEYRITPRYRTVAATGPDHARWFTVEVLAGSQVLAIGEGHSKAAAQQKAAQAALEAIERGELRIPANSVTSEQHNDIDPG
jgi:ribonuclease-3